MEKSRDEINGEFSEVKEMSEHGYGPSDIKVVRNAAAGLDDENSEQRIGRYRLIRPIGEGGMGVVWRAVQEHPVKRDVALKLVRDDIGKNALARFEGERQAIAMMDHPNIAKILDADTTDNGHPYFVMELVKGIPLDQYCNNHKLSVEQRLRLMVPICRAVQHAHQKAILHRDLKHSNILVGEDDDKPTPKIIDFGLAKALAGRKSLTDKTVFTEFGKVVGTISYMSPEQADTDGMDIDTRSDIYSLGVVLYKLLVGKTPIQLEDEGLSVIGAIKIIRDKDPIVPSVAVRKNEDCKEWAAASTPLSPERLAEQLKGDLDSIVLKALEKDRRSRYETASGLALDIERYLNNEPVLARPLSTVYSIQKFVQRNRGLVASLATIATLLIGGIVVTSLLSLFAISQANFAKLEAKRRSVQLKAQLGKSTWSDHQRSNVEVAWQSLRQMRDIDPANPGWIGRYLANEMNTCNPENMLRGGHAHYVLTVDASSGGDYILSGGADDAVYLWNAHNNQRIYRRTFDDIVKCVRFSSDQKQFAVADRANIVSVFDTASGDLVRKFGPYVQDVSSLYFHPSEPILAFGFFDNDTERPEDTVRIDLFENAQPADLMLVNFKSGETLQTIKGHRQEINSVVFDGAGERLVSGCFDGNLRIFKLQSSPDKPDSKIRYELERTIIAHPRGINSVDMSLDGKLIASCGEDKVASVWNAETGELIVNLAGHSREVLGVAISPGGDMVATSSSDDTAIVWSLDGEQIVKWRGHAYPINDVCFTADGKEIITAADDQTLRRWSAKPSGTSVTYTPARTTAEIWQADFSPDKETVAVASEQGCVFLIGSRDGKLKETLPHAWPVLSLTWLSDGRLITGCEGGHELLVWDRLDGSEESIKPSQTIPLPEGVSVWDISASPNEDRIIVACDDLTARVFDSTSFKEIAVLKNHEDGLASASFSHDGKLIATGCDDASIGIWDANSYEHLYTLEGHALGVWRAVFSPTNSNLLASSSNDGKVLLWDLKSRKPMPVEIAGHNTAVAGLTFTADGQSLVSASDDGTVRIWDVETGVELFIFQNPMAEILMHASFSRDGQSLVTCGVGIVDIRHATKSFADPYLIGDSVADVIKKEELDFAKVTSSEELERIVATAENITDNYPSWEGFEILGIAQYRLGRHEEAVESLEESWRLKRILYGMLGGSRPDSLGYLVLALVETGDLERAREVRETLDLIAEEYWAGDEYVQLLQSKANAAIGD